MGSSLQGIENLTLNINQEIHVRAPLDATFAALLEEMGPRNETPEGKPLPMKIEARPGGRWYRDLGEDNGHFWGLVQAIKRPTLLEITGTTKKGWQGGGPISSRPLCIANSALMVAGATSTGGLAAIVINKLRVKTNTNERRIDHEQESDRTSESRRAS